MHVHRSVHPCCISRPPVGFARRPAMVVGLGLALALMLLGGPRAAHASSLTVSAPHSQQTLGAHDHS